ncbi:major head protein [Staphylococcus phage phiSA_BS1]|uniref:Major capsid protein n=2 Tax=Baoshanvirus TaxID=2732969 RepID=A0A2P1MXI8_9CAUD|nr:major head protein [Staphylococcus phage phiSA_BS1]YP_009799931.1 major head protein [Staphylococcus phage phiSA_BS2]AVP40276.1 major capsid protein [Staphylococcus phage phiSA_BS1]AVR55535.1 major capsid protein [Staphylococcus phage phiSA_BS2]WFG34045.1 major capsid protein [Staphylococcus phage vB_SauM_JDF86]
MTEENKNGFEQKLKPSQREFAENLQEQLSKSFQTGYGITPDTQIDAGALRREILDDQITMLTYTNEDLIFFRQITKRPAQSTVMKYDVYLNHGEVGHSGFVREIGVAPVSDPNIRQKTVNMKYVSSTRNMSIATTLVNNVEDPAQILTEDAIVTVAKNIEWASFYGDASLSSEPTNEGGLEFDGLVKLISKENVIDAKGKALDQLLLNDAAVHISKGFGQPTDAFMPLGVHAEFVNDMLSNQRQLMSDNSGNLTAGYNVQGFNSVRGHIALHGSTVMENDLILDESVQPKPNAPQPAKVNATVKTDQKGKFEDPQETEVNYKVVVNSDEAKSYASEVVQAQVSNATDAVELTIQLQSMYQSQPQFVSIYRQGKNTGLFYLIDRVAVSQQNEEGNIVYLDRNENLPETADVFVGELTPTVIHLFELLPMMRLPLAQINASITFAVLWYGALALRAPKKWARIKNVRYTAVNPYAH